MITLRLFHSTDPFRPIESRTLEGGELSIGRDPSAQWCIPDAAREVSRRHCVIMLRDGAVFIQDTSANGVYFGNERRRIESDTPVEVTPHQSIHLGQYMIVMEPLSAANDQSPSQALDAPFHQPLLAPAEVSADALDVPSAWNDATTTPRNRSNAALLDAFCEGADLDASAFAGEDPVAVMRRCGAVYQQMVVGLGDLMSERSSLKCEYRMDRTTVSAAGNNPFKWASSQRLAVDLLRAREDGFLYGPAALRASFVDLKKHLLCLAAGSRAAIAAVLDHLEPGAIEHSTKAAPALLLLAKAELCWRAFKSRRDALVYAAQTSADSLVNCAFRRGYEDELRRLDQLSTHQ